MRSLYRLPIQCCIAVRFAYEWHEDSGNWFRSYGNENWEFDEHGFMGRRIASINDLLIQESDRFESENIFYSIVRDRILANLKLGKQFLSASSLDCCTLKPHG